MGRAAVLLMLVLAGCTHAGPPPKTYAEELAALDAACRAGGGRLTPAGNSITDDPANDFVCSPGAADQAPG